MRSEEKIKEKIRTCHEAIQFVKEKGKEDGSIDLIAQEIQTLEWMLGGPKRHSLDEIHRVLKNNTNDFRENKLNVPKIMAILAKNLERY